MMMHNLGLPRIGIKRELKKALEQYWKGIIDKEKLFEVGLTIKQKNWSIQQMHDTDLITVGDFSFYDHILDTSFLLGNIPKRFINSGVDELESYFSIARGYNNDNKNITPSDMRKWFNTNYHYIVPEFTQNSVFKLNPKKIINEINEALDYGISISNIKPVITGPLTYLKLGNESEISKMELLPSLIKEYKELLTIFNEMGILWVQIDEPILVLDHLDEEYKNGFSFAYNELKGEVNILLTTYFEGVEDNIDIIKDLPVQGFHFDLTKDYSEELRECTSLIESIADDKIISLGCLSGKNVWASNISLVLNKLKPVYKNLGDRLWIAPSCSLIHLPVTVKQEDKLPENQKKWLKFAHERLNELSIIKNGIAGENIDKHLFENRESLDSLAKSRVLARSLKDRLDALSEKEIGRKSGYKIRAEQQRKYLNLPRFPSTTIGSFPQTSEVRETRLMWKKGSISDHQYRKRIKEEIKSIIHKQEELHIDVLVHGEPERTDMVEYFGELLDGYLVTRFGWVQSYGSRCVKPPIIYGDIARPKPMTVKWINYAQSLTNKPVKGMLTGPVTMLKWVFVRQDIPFSKTSEQVALSLNDEVKDLIKSGIKIIQIDEAALREALPLKSKYRKDYLFNAARAFRICSLNIDDEIQIHTHMCYSNFDDILEAISKMDADVLTIETSRSKMKILSSFPRPDIINEIGPGIYDVHSPNIPTEKHMISLIKRALRTIPAERLWVNPDCGLKTRNWKEVTPSLKNMINATEKVRAALDDN